MTGKIVELPSDFIGREDELKLESFGGHLIARGCASRWHWNRKHGVDVAFELFRGGAEESPLVTIKRDRAKDVFYVLDASGRRLEEGKLEHVMSFVDERARSRRGDTPA